MNFLGKTVLITGASRGIGQATAMEFAQKGANVVLTARDQSSLSQIVSDIGKNAIAITADIAHYEQVKTVVNKTIETFGGLDVVVNNAATIEPIAHFLTSDPKSWTRSVDVNLNGVYYAIHAALPHMLKNGGGTFLTVSSGAAHKPIEAWSHYCAAKAGVHMLTQCLDLEQRHNGIRAIGLSPGTVATQMQKEIKASGINPVSQLDWSDHIPPQWPAKTLCWLASDAGDEYLGQEVSLRDEAILKSVGLL